MVKEPSNIELFDTTVLYLANILYQSFPRCIEINVYEELTKDPFSVMKIDDIEK